MNFYLFFLLTTAASFFTSSCDAFVVAEQRQQRCHHQCPALSATASKQESLKKADLIAAVAEQSGLTKKDTEAVVTALLATIRDEVAKGKKVTLPGLGSFTSKERSARKGRNPQTGEEMDIAASISPSFTASKTWKDELNGKY